jgi:hypothetical protein
MVGSLVEAAFTTTTFSARSSRPVLRGPSTPWMVPIYGLAMPLFEPVHDRLRSRPAWQRGLAYAAGILAVEGLTGWALRRLTGRCPWDYSGRSPLALGGLVRLDYSPLWALTGLGAERLHDALIGIAILPNRHTGSPADPSRTDGNGTGRRRGAAREAPRAPGHRRRS